jgi:phosphate starvation-inducible PhoH-like protein
MGRRRNSALRQEQEQFNMISNKKNQTFYQKHEGNINSNTINFNVAKKQKKSIDIVPKSINQESYILALKNQETDVVVVSGPAGTGKTYLAILSALSAYRNKECDKIILCRPAISIENESHGFLPGDLNSKLEPWVKPMVDILREYYTMKELEYFLSEEIIEFAPLGMTRGRTFKNSWIILDESQNATPTQLKALLTRIGQGSKIIIGGDIEQTDRKTKDNGLQDLIKRLKSFPINGIEVCEFDIRDIQRHRLISEIIKLYN